MPDRPLPRITLATRVTLLRILGIPVFVLLMVYYHMSLRADAPNEMFRIAALGVFVLVAATDALDGYLARSRHEITELGRILDPLADKGLLLSAVVMLTRPSLPALQPQLPVWFTLTIVSRDVLLVLGAVVINHLAHRVEIRPRLTGKAATFFQMATVVCALAVCGPGPAFTGLAMLAAACTLVSGLQYTFDGIRQIEAHTHPVPRDSGRS